MGQKTLVAKPLPQAGIGSVVAAPKDVLNVWVKRLRPMPSRIHSERVRSSASRVPGVVKWLQLDLRSGPAG